jgi:hypothetical protein
MWHYRKKRGLDGLWRRPRFEIPAPPTADPIARISADRSALDDQLDSEWEKEFALGLGWFHTKEKR